MMRQRGSRMLYLLPDVRYVIPDGKFPNVKDHGIAAPALPLTLHFSPQESIQF